MEIRSDIILRGNTWKNVKKGYVGKLFDTTWGVFLACMSVGILYDKQIDDENPNEADDNDDDENKVSIPRTMFNRNAQEMQFYFQAAILSSNCVDLTEKDRLYLAFSENISAEELTDSERELMRKGISTAALEFDKVDFLTKFANFGATKFYDCLSKNDTETMDNLMEFLEDSYNGETEELIQMKELEDLEDSEGLE